MLYVHKSSAYYLYPDLCDSLVKITQYLINAFDLESKDLDLRFTMNNFDGNADSYRFKDQCITLNIARIYEHSELVSNNIYECLCHEFCHHVQWCEGRLKYIGGHCQYNGKLYDNFVWCLEQYVQLPWEIEANDFMRIVTPNVVELFDLPQRTALTAL